MICSRLFIKIGKYVDDEIVDHGLTDLHTSKINGNALKINCIINNKKNCELFLVPVVK